MSQLVHVVCVCAFLYPSINAARILVVVPSPSLSHQVVFRPLTQELARLGHQVVVITTDPAFPKGQAPANLTEIDVHDISYFHWRNLIQSYTHGDKDDVPRQMDNIAKLCINIFEKQCEEPEVRDIIENQRDSFDLLILESWTRFALGFSHIIKAPVITMSSLGGVLDAYHVMGAPTHPLLYPPPTNTRIYNLTLWEKIKQFYTYYSILYQFEKNEAFENVVVKRIFGQDTPELSELQNNIDLLFVNTYPLWEGNRPVPPSVIHVGGIHQKPEQDLPQDLKKYLDSSKHGVIYVSFGTNVETSVLPLDKVEAMINVFSRLPYDVLWKWNHDELPGRTKNIRISKWLPQSDLLRHANVKLFVTQGGLQSTDETITAGVPVIGIPMFADQWYNVEKYVHHKIGKMIEFADLDEETFQSAVKEVIGDKSYRANVVRLRTLLHDQPQQSLARAAWWAAHALRRGGRHLRAPAANMRAARYYELRALAAVMAAALAATAALAAIVCYIVKVISGRMRGEKVKTT